MGKQRAIRRLYLVFCRVVWRRRLGSWRSKETQEPPGDAARRPGYKAKMTL